MNVLVIGSDRKIFEKGSAVRERVIEYGGSVGELHVIVFSRRVLLLSREQIAPNVWIYPTNSRSRWEYITDAIRVGKIISGVDVISTQDPFEAGFVGYRLKRTLGASLHVQVHTDFLSPHFSKKSILNRVRAIIARHVLERADCVRVVSNRIKEALEKKYKLRQLPVVLPIFVDFKEMKNVSSTLDLHKKYSQFEFIILLVSRLESEKDIPLALNALERVIEKYQKVCLVIVGDGSERQALERAVKKAGIEKSVFFEGWQKQDDLARYYQTTDLFLNTSLYEGYGRTLVEAAYNGCPIVTTDVGIVGEILSPESVWMCDVGNAECVVKSMIDAIENADVRRRRARNAQEAVKARTISTKGEYLHRYKQTLENCL